MCVSDWEAGRRANHRIDATIRAEGRSALIFHPFLDFSDPECLRTEEAATHVATAKLCLMIGGVTVCSVKRLKRKFHWCRLVEFQDVHNGVAS